MAKFDLTDTSNPKVWSPEAQDFIPYDNERMPQSPLPYDGTDTLGDFNKQKSSYRKPKAVSMDQGYKRHTSGAQREKMTSVRYDYMPARLVNEAYGAVGTHGAEKYDTDNWMKGLPQSQIAGSLQRHLWEYFDGHDFDDGPKGSGLPHVYHILWNAVALLYGYENKLEDDRFESRKTSN